MTEYLASVAAKQSRQKECACCMLVGISVSPNCSSAVKPQVEQSASRSASSISQTAQIQQEAVEERRRKRNWFRMC